MGGEKGVGEPMELEELLRIIALPHSLSCLSPSGGGESEAVLS